MSTHPAEEKDVRLLYRTLLDRWNARDADGFAALFADDGNVVGFDGSQLNGRAEIAGALRRIFADHPTAEYVEVVRAARFPSAGAGILRAVVGMVPRGQPDLTPAVFHGRTALAAALTGDLRQALRRRSAGRGTPSR